MSDTPWLGDACSLVDAFRAGERSPVEELEATLAAIDSTQLNCFTYLAREQAREHARTADVSKPFGGVPVGIKELEPVDGWPYTEASLVYRDRVGTHDSTQFARLRDAGGVVPVGQTLASEFGGLNVSINKVSGTCHNPWRHGRTAGGSSGGSSSAVAGGLVTLASGGDGGGSIRIPAGFNGLVGMKGTVGRIPRGPKTQIGPMTVVVGCVARSVRDVCRWFDVTSGHERHDPYSLPRIDGWERDLGTHDLRGKKVAIAPTLGVAIVRDEVQQRIVAAGEALARDAGLEIVDIDVTLPQLDLTWALGNLSGLKADLGDLWPDCKDDLTTEIAFGLTIAQQMLNLDVLAQGENARTAANEAMADLFDQVDFVICASNPDTAFPADVYLNTRVGDLHVEGGNNGALTIPANISGNPAISIPVEQFDGLPVGMQVIGRHHEDALLLDLAQRVERERPWPLVATGAPV
ncbi:MAG: aspartyl-tRNA(Asn)/glutamyl-tRNA(Gln) amidotransferase subunit [Nocardioidaceae bacterium]|nr:aspartyl-tRNA(Asn)/glutamyl-tRNA(Gln) amidotransferase subunit [Nocardioidaceae bacterium]